MSNENAEQKAMDAIKVLEQSVIEMKERAAKRDSGQGERSMDKTVKMFNLLYGLTLTEEQGWAFMVMLKMVRGSQGAFHLDDYVDAAAYSALQGEAAHKQFIKDSEAAKPETPIQGSMHMHPGLIPSIFFKKEDYISNPDKEHPLKRTVERPPHKGWSDRGR
jgi:hypothetical protein